MSARLTDKQLAEFRATWHACDPMIMALDEIDAVRAERDSARELLARLEKELPALSRNVMADCVAEVAAMRVEAERRGWEACREAILAYFRIAWTDVTSGSELEDGIHAIEPPPPVAVKVCVHECMIEQEEHPACVCECGATWDRVGDVPQDWGRLPGGSEPAKDFDTAVDEVRDAFKAVQEGKVERASEPTKRELASWLRNWACVGCGAGYPTLLDNRVVCGKCNKVTSDAPAKDTP